MSNGYIISGYLPLQSSVLNTRKQKNNFVLNINNLSLFGTFQYVNTADYLNAKTHSDMLPPEFRLLVPSRLVKYTYFPELIAYKDADTITIEPETIFFDGEVSIPLLDDNNITDYWLHNCNHNIQLVCKQIAEEMKNENI